MSFEKTLASGFPPSGESTVQGGGSHGSGRGASHYTHICRCGSSSRPQALFNTSADANP
jgi:hypothetical protein